MPLLFCALRRDLKASSLDKILLSKYRNSRVADMQVDVVNRRYGVLAGRRIGGDFF